MIRPALFLALVLSLSLGAAAEAGLLEVGAPVPAFSLPCVDGTTFELRPGPQAAPVLLAFVSVGCRACEQCAPALDGAQERYGSEVRLRVACIALCNEGAARWLSKSGKYGPRISLLVERIEGTRFLTADAFGVETTPAFFLVGSEGRIRWRHEGPVTREGLEAEVGRALALAPGTRSPP